MFQEVCRESLRAILEHPWVQRNFVVSNNTPPEVHHTNIPEYSYVSRLPDGIVAPYFSLLLMSRNMAIGNCFRVPFVSEMGRDALVVDIPVTGSTKQTATSKEYLRLCTTHLESHDRGFIYRHDQLRVISALLKEKPTATKSRIVAGIVGGDMSAVFAPDHKCHKETDVDLRDVWEDVPAPPMPKLKPFQKDPSCGRARGNTWGYQTNSAWGYQTNHARERIRLDKFFYTGPIETVGLDEVQDVTGRLGRLGMGLRTEVDVWKEESVDERLVRGRLVEKPLVRYFSDQEVERMREIGWLGDRELVRTKVDAWVSDHFGIAVGVRFLGSCQCHELPNYYNDPLYVPETRPATNSSRE